MNIAFITGISGQDGSYLAELLLEKNYKIYGMVRRISYTDKYNNIEHIKDKLNLLYGDMTDSSSLLQIINKIINDNDIDNFEIYNLAAQSQVKTSFDTPEYTNMVDSLGPLKLLEIIRSLDLDIRNKIKFYQAGSSEMFGDVLETPQTENTPFNPQSPYACSKVYTHYIVKNYREAYNLFACNGILFNHESPRRGGDFVTKKIINGVKDIQNNKLEFITLGNLNSKRDWGHSKDYVYGMWLMLQQDKPDDYVLSTGISTTVREFVEKSFLKIGINIIWEGSGYDEIGKDNNGRILIKIDKNFFRPCEVNTLCGDCTKAKNILNWNIKFNLDKLIDDMFI